MAQDPKKEAKEIERTSLKDKLKQVSPEKKAPLKKVAEMGKPSLMPKFEAAMQKERDFVLNRAKLREEAEEMGKENRYSRMAKDIKGENYPALDSEKFNDWRKKQSIMSAAERGNKNAILKELNNMKSPKLKSMSKNKLKY